jgi:hypothetical protein
MSVLDGTVIGAMIHAPQASQSKLRVRRKKAALPSRCTPPFRASRAPSMHACMHKCERNNEHERSGRLCAPNDMYDTTYARGRRACVGACGACAPIAPHGAHRYFHMLATATPMSPAPPGDRTSLATPARAPARPDAANDQHMR